MNNSFFDFKIFPIQDAKSILENGKGAGQKGTIVVIQANQEINELEAFLEKMLRAVQLDLHQDTTLLNLTTSDTFSFSELSKYQNNIKKCIVFGVSPKRLGLQFILPKYKVLQHGTIQYLFADDIQAIYTERQAGGKKMSGTLWKALQTMFI